MRLNYKLARSINTMLIIALQLYIWFCDIRYLIYNIFKNISWKLNQNRFHFVIK